MYQLSVYPITPNLWRWEIRYQLSVYPITPNLWRWEIRCGGALLRCGAAPTRVAAERDAKDVAHS